MPVEIVLDALRAKGIYLKKEGKGWKARCPLHDDKTPSLQISEGKGSRALIHCFSGCKIEEILAALNLNMSDMFTGRKQIYLTVEELASAKNLPKHFLLELGVKDFHGSVKITYRDLDSSLECRQRRRTALKARQGSSWYPDKKPIVPYGLWRLPFSKKAGKLIIVEGESDCWAGWYHKFQVLGLPGADTARYLMAEHLDRIKTLYILREPDAGGKTFLRGLSARLLQLGFTGEVRVLIMPDGVKDLCELHIKDPKQFSSSLEELLKSCPALPDAPLDAGIAVMESRLDEFLFSELKLYRGLYLLEQLQGTDPGDTFLATYRQIQASTGLVPSAISRAQKALILKGWINVQPGEASGSKRAPSKYQRLLPPPIFSQYCHFSHYRNDSVKPECLGQTFDIIATEKVALAYVREKRFIEKKKEKEKLNREDFKREKRKIESLKKKDLEKECLNINLLEKENNTKENVSEKYYLSHLREKEENEGEINIICSDSPIKSEIESDVITKNVSESLKSDEKTCHHDTDSHPDIISVALRIFGGRVLKDNQPS